MASGRRSSFPSFFWHFSSFLSSLCADPYFLHSILGTQWPLLPILSSPFSSGILQTKTHLVCWRSKNVFHTHQVGKSIDGANFLEHLHFSCQSQVFFFVIVRRWRNYQFIMHQNLVPAGSANCRGKWSATSTFSHISLKTIVVIRRWRLLVHCAPRSST